MTPSQDDATDRCGGGGDWRPIETAPRDRFVLLYTPEDGEMVGYVAMAKWQSGSWFGIDDEGLTFNPLQAWDRVTHWMPLPGPPASPAPPEGGLMLGGSSVAGLPAHVADATATDTQSHTGKEDR